MADEATVPDQASLHSGLLPASQAIERLWGLMHRHITHNKCYASFKDFSIAMLTFLRDDVPKNWDTYCDRVTDNFRIINPKDFRVLT